MIYCHAAKISGIIYYVTCCYAAEISGIVYYVTYMLLRCWDLWDRVLRYIHVATLLRSLVSFTTLHTCCYAAEISGIIYYVTYMLLRCWDLWYRLLRYMLLRCWDLWYRLLRYMLLRCWDLWDRLLRYIHVATLLRSLRSLRAWQWRCIHKNADCQLFTTHALQRWRWKTKKNAPQVFPGFPIIKLARHCGKITIFLKMCVLWERFPVRRDVYALFKSIWAIYQWVFDTAHKNPNPEMTPGPLGPPAICPTLAFTTNATIAAPSPPSPPTVAGSVASS